MAGNRFAVPSFAGLSAMLDVSALIEVVKSDAVASGFRWRLVVIIRAVP